MSKTLIAKFGTPSQTFDDYSGQYKGASANADREAAIAADQGTHAMFWMYEDGSAIDVRVSSKLSVETVFESRFVTVRAPTR